jgi:hypothetical protein
MDEPIEQKESRKEKKRHWFLTTWLILLAVGNIAVAIIYLLRLNAFSYMPAWVIPVELVTVLFNLVGIIALFMWKRWGFWLLCGTCIISFIVNLSLGLSIGLSILGLIGLPVLFGILQIGRENKGWTQLE